MEWFRKAKFGLFMHYGVYSILGRGEWVMLREAIPVAEYSKLKEQFTAGQFDAGKICDLALAAGMKYVNMTARHHDGFCLFKTGQTEFSSLDSPARRDLIGELTQACHKRGLGIFYYYSYALDWRHPYFYSRDAGLASTNAPWGMGRPDYKAPEPGYLYRKPEDFRKYIDFVHAQLRELLTQYGPVTGIWLDPIMGYYARPELVPDPGELRADPQAPARLPDLLQTGRQRRRGLRRAGAHACRAPSGRRGRKESLGEEQE